MSGDSNLLNAVYIFVNLRNRAFCVKENLSCFDMV